MKAMQWECNGYVYQTYIYTSTSWLGLGLAGTLRYRWTIRRDLIFRGHIRAYTSVRNICYFLLSLLLVVVLFYLPTYAYRQDIMDLIIRYHNLLPCSRLMYSSFIDENNKNVLSHNVKPAHGILLLKGPKNKKNNRQKK